MVGNSNTGHHVDMVTCMVLNTEQKNTKKERLFMVDSFMVAQEKEKAMHRVWNLEETMRVLWRKLQVSQAAVNVQIEGDLFNPSPAILSDMETIIRKMKHTALLMDGEKRTLQVLKNTLSYMEA